MKNGFTLVELLATIALMAIVVAISIPAYNAISHSIKEQNLNSKLSMIENATKGYVNKYHKDKVNISDNSKYICYTINYLIEKNVISPDNSAKNGITDPLNDGKLSGVIAINYDIDNFDINVKYSKNIENFSETMCTEKF